MATMLILGARSDIAIPLAEKCAKNGYDLILAARQCTSLSGFAEDLRRRYACKTTLVEFDVLKHQEHANFYAQLSTKPDAAICLVGYLGNPEKATVSHSDIALIMETNLFGCISILDIIAEDFCKRKAGIILGVSSIAGERGKASNIYYCSAKAGFTAYLSGLRNRVSKSNVRVITILPGYVKTKMLRHLNPPALLVEKPEKIAADIWQAMKGTADVVYVAWYWRYLMLAIKLLPEKIFQRLSL